MTTINIEREKLNITKQQAREIIWGDSAEFEIISDDIIDNSRWSIIHEIVVKRIIDGKFFRDHYQRGSTEQQDESPYEYSEPDFREVFPKLKTITIYE